MSWRKIFLVEGIITTGIEIICLLIIPADPEQYHPLTKEERTLALKRIAADKIIKNLKHEKTTLRLVLRAFNFNVNITRTVKPHAHFCHEITGCSEYIVFHAEKFPRIKLVYANHHCDV